MRLLRAPTISTLRQSSSASANAPSGPNSRNMESELQKEEPTMSRLEEYANKYQDIRMQRRNGVLEVTLHNKGNSLVWNESVHRELPYACTDLGADPENKVVILTRVGDSFCADIDFASFGSG